MFKTIKKFCYQHPIFSSLFFPNIAELFLSILFFFFIGLSFIHHHFFLVKILSIMWQISFGGFGYIIFTKIENYHKKIENKKQIYSVEKIYDYQKNISYSTLEKEMNQ